MDKVLKALVVILLLLSIAALMLAMDLFGKRELLKGRAQKLENAIVALGAALESDVTAPDRPPAYPERDISDCTEEAVDAPELAEFWKEYDPALEMQENPTLDLKSRRMELMVYHKIDPITQKVMLDPMGSPVDEGDGTMQNVLNDVLAKAGDQYNRLNKTRQQLADLRVELVDAVQELNARKKDLRDSLKVAKEMRVAVDPLKQQIAEITTRVEELKEEKQTIENRILDQKDQIARISEQSTTKDALINQLKIELTDAKGGVGSSSPLRPPAGDPTSETPVQVPVLPTGTKGVVAAVNDEWNFVVLDLSQDFLLELMGEDLSSFVPVELMIKRAAGPDTFVTKVRLMQVKADSLLGIADVLSDWQQAPVRAGDIVSY